VDLLSLLARSFAEIRVRYVRADASPFAMPQGRPIQESDYSSSSSGALDGSDAE
jgi:hypothetical protein